ncbi:hypothetical protein RF074_11635, partial [Serratia marcescens]|uniref:hypothetical protein n=1 Tax=Serratia marcescens TaxID=615 RepID=UPI002813DBAC
MQILEVFNALMTAGLGPFLGDALDVYEEEVKEFISNARVEGEDVISKVGETIISLIESVFAGLFKLPTEG